MNEKIKELIKAMEENPELEVKFMNSSDIKNAEAIIAFIEIGFWIPKDKYIYTNYDEFIDSLEGEFKTYKEVCEKYPIDSFEKKIIVYL